MMAFYWASPQAAKNDALVAERMNALPKVVFSRTLDKASWSNTRLVKGDLPGEVRKLKKEAGPDMVILGSASVISSWPRRTSSMNTRLSSSPSCSAGGKSMFAGVSSRPSLKLAGCREFKNGNVLLSYAASP